MSKFYDGVRVKLKKANIWIGCLPPVGQRARSDIQRYAIPAGTKGVLKETKYSSEDHRDFHFVPDDLSYIKKEDYKLTTYNPSEWFEVIDESS